MLQKKLIIKGHLQGVGYRAFVCATARWMKVKGTVKNLGDGSVEIICGCRDAVHLEEFKKELGVKGNDRYSANVEAIEIEDIPHRKLGYFDIDYGADVSNRDIATKIDVGSNIMRSMNVEMRSMNTEMRSMNTEMKSMNTNMTSRFDVVDTKYGSLNDSLKELVRIFKEDYEVTLKPKKKKKKP